MTPESPELTKYNSQKFIDELTRASPKRRLVCPYCKGKEFTTTEYAALIPVEKDLTSHFINITTRIPAGLLICKKCGHIDFFALAALGLKID